MTQAELQTAFQQDSALQDYVKWSSEASRQLNQNSRQWQGVAGQQLRDQIAQRVSALPPQSQALLQQLKSADLTPVVDSGGPSLATRGFTSAANWIWGATLALAGGLGVGGALAGAGGVGTGGGTAAADTAATTIPTTIGIDSATAAALPGATAVGTEAGLTAGAVGAGADAATAIPSGAAASLPSDAAVVGPASGGSTLSTIGNALRDPSTLSAAGKAISAATTASQSNQRQDAGITQNAYVQDAQLEAQQRREALRNIYAQGVVSSGQHGPYDPTPPIPSAAYIAALNNLQQQGSQRLGQPAQYATTNFPNPNSYTNPTTLQTAGTYLGPALQIAGTFLGR